MSRTSKVQKMVIMLGLVMAALIATSGAAIAAKINTVQCPNVNNSDCTGTNASDRMVGRETEFDSMEGKGGKDIYDGKGGGDSYFDRSKRSSDRYLVPSTDFGDLFIEDDGGGSDVLDAKDYKSTDFTYSRFGSDSDELLMTGAGTRDIRLFDFFKKNTIDSFKFSDGTLTAKQIKSKVP